MSVLFQYHGINVHSLSDAEDKGLMQLTHWLPNIESEKEYLEKEYFRISSDKHRTCMLVKYGNSLALFVNKIA